MTTANNFSSIQSLSAPDRKKMEGFVNEISNSLLRMDAERDQIKAICDKAKNDLEIKPTVLRKMARLHYKNTLVEEKMKSEELFELYEQIFS